TPYELNRATYASAPAFLISKPIKSLNRGPAYFRAYFSTEAFKYHYRESPLQLARSVLAKIFHTWNFYVGATLAVAFFAGLRHARREYFLWGASAFFMAGYFLETWNFPQYTAPLFPLLLIFTMRGFEWLRTSDGPHGPARLFLARAMPTAVVALLALPIVSLVSGSPSLGENSIQTICCSTEYDQLRPALRRQLLASPGRDLVLVKDGLQNPTGYDLVHNEADIDKAEVVWAHRLSPEKDSRLQQYFADRRVWEFEWLEPESADNPQQKASKQPYRFRLLTVCSATIGNAGCREAEHPEQAK
ncbi:MAG: putative rane protein, partial [Polaromonas sp.]|nr:putative rane protein [Polaromonas sp.]